MARKRSHFDDEEPSQRSSHQDPAESVQDRHSYSPQDLQQGLSSTIQQGDAISVPERSPGLPLILPFGTLGTSKPSQSNGASFTSSEPPLTSSSQRVVRNGERMVTNSDEDDDATSSLEDLDDVIQRQRQINEMTVLSQTPPTDIGRQTKSTETDVGGSQLPSASTRSMKVVSTTDRAFQYDKSFSQLKARKRKLESSTADVAKLNAMLEARDRLEENNEQEAPGARQSENLLDSLMSQKKDEEEANQLRIALSRTEALQVDSHWSFFDSSMAIQEPAEIEPAPGIESNNLDAMIRDQRFRQQAFLGGFMGEHAAKDGLPQGILTWIINALCSETREDLRLAYVDTIAQTGMQITSLFSTDAISDLFRRLGARAEALDLQAMVVPSVSMGETLVTPPRAALSSILNLVGKISSRLGDEARQHTIILLCRLILDRSIMIDCSQQITTETALATLIDSDFDEGKMASSPGSLANIYNSVSDATLRLQLLRGLPTSSIASAIFRQRLALAFFFANPAHLQNTAAVPSVDLKLMAARLLTPTFRISKSTDFASLAAIIGTLDIAIDSGSRSCKSVTPKGTGTDAEKAAKVACDAIEKTLNDDVDCLAAAIKKLSAQIVDTSALNIRRTDAKEVLDGLYRRLVYAVRTKPPTRRLLSGEGGPEGERNIMEMWRNGCKPKVLDETPANANDVIYNPNT